MRSARLKPCSFSMHPQNAGLDIHGPVCRRNSAATRRTRPPTPGPHPEVALLERSLAWSAHCRPQRLAAIGTGSAGLLHGSALSICRYFSMPFSVSSSCGTPARSQSPRSRSPRLRRPRSWLSSARLHPPIRGSLTCLHPNERDGAVGRGVFEVPISLAAGPSSERQGTKPHWHHRLASVLLLRRSHWSVLQCEANVGSGAPGRQIAVPAQSPCIGRRARLDSCSNLNM